MLGGADNPNGELPSYITGADKARRYFQDRAKAALFSAFQGDSQTRQIMYATPEFVRSNRGSTLCKPLTNPAC